MQGWLNVTRMLLRADYIGFHCLRLDKWCAIVVAVDLRMFWVPWSKGTILYMVSRRYIVWVI